MTEIELDFHLWIGTLTDAMRCVDPELSVEENLLRTMKSTVKADGLTEGLALKASILAVLYSLEITNDPLGKRLDYQKLEEDWEKIEYMGFCFSGCLPKRTPKYPTSLSISIFSLWAQCTEEHMKERSLS